MWVFIFLRVNNLQVALLFESTVSELYDFRDFLHLWFPERCNPFLINFSYSLNVKKLTLLQDWWRIVFGNFSPALWNAGLQQLFPISLCYQQNTALGFNGPEKRNRQQLSEETIELCRTWSLRRRSTGEETLRSSWTSSVSFEGAFLLWLHMLFFQEGCFMKLVRFIFTMPNSIFPPWTSKDLADKVCFLEECPSLWQ